MKVKIGFKGITHGTDLEKNNIGSSYLTLEEAKKAGNLMAYTSDIYLAIIDKIKKNNPPLEIKGSLYCHTIPEVELCGDSKEIKNALEQFKTAGLEPEYVVKPSIIPFLNETSLYGYLSVKKTIKGMGGKVKGTTERFPRNAKCISFEDAKT